jgi:hypothetical protein
VSTIAVNEVLLVVVIGAADISVAAAAAVSAG